MTPESLPATQPALLTVLLFGITRDIVGQSSLSLPMPADGTVGGLFATLRARYPALAALRSLAVAVNSEYAFETDPLHPHDEIALIPPVAGG